MSWGQPRCVGVGRVPAVGKAAVWCLEVGVMVGRVVVAGWGKEVRGMETWWG